MTASFVAEQSSAGLDRLTDEEHGRFESFNAAYREKFGFPFIIAVRRHTKASILAQLERRLRNTTAAEIEPRSLRCFDITRMRLGGLVTS